MAYNLLEPFRGCLHFHFETQEELCHAFMRVQEFYESPYREIRGHYFTHEQFAERYMATHGRPFSYYGDWNGFNIPGPAIKEFLKTFPASALSEAERAIFAHVEPLVALDLDSFYVIGTHAGYDVGDHEYAHALFFLNKEYRLEATTEIARLALTYPHTMMALKMWIIDRGYSENVLVDEFQAYMATTPAEYFIEKLDRGVGTMLYTIAEPISKIWQKWKRASV